jgi:hypothetical protein
MFLREEKITLCRICDVWTCGGKVATITRAAEDTAIHGGMDSPQFELIPAETARATARNVLYMTKQ